MQRVRDFFGLLTSGSWMTWGGVLLAAGTAGVAEACGANLLGSAICNRADDVIQGLGTLLVVVGARNAPGIRG